MPSVTVPAALMAVSTIGGAASSIMSSQSQASALKASAASERIAGGQALASSQRDALTEQQKATLVGSSATAQLAAGGGGAADPTSINILANIKGQGNYNALSALYEGQEKNRQYQTQANTDTTQASDALKAGWINAFGTILKGGTSMYDKYGAGMGFDSTGTGYATGKSGYG